MALQKNVQWFDIELMFTRVAGAVFYLTESAKCLWKDNKRTHFVIVLQFYFGKPSIGNCMASWLKCIVTSLVETVVKYVKKHYIPKTCLCSCVIIVE